MISQNSIESLRSHLDVVDVISNYIELKKSGGNFKAPCPFHSEDSPSFVVSPAKQIYKCFGCGAGGDSIKFVMEYEKLSYPEAIEKLAADFNFRLEYDTQTQKQTDTKIMEDLHAWWKKLLDQNRTAMQYLHERGVHESSIEKFGIAYAPSGNETVQFLRSIHANLQEAVELGVIGQENGRYFARFIERIMFPIYAQNGKLVGFGGRTITGHQAKYVNSPQTKLFNKSKLLYAYNIARDAIYRQKQMIVTEGYLDVVMLHQAGFNTAVATLGTALTPEHLPLLRKGEPKIIMAYDGDNAGKNAALKAAKLLSSAGIDGGVVLFKEGLDPADMVKNDRLTELNALFHDPKKLPQFVIETIIAQYDLKDPYDKERALHEAMGYLKSLSPVLQDAYKGLIAALLGVSAGLVRVNAPAPLASPQNKKVAAPLEERDIWELTLVKTMLEHPSLIDMVVDYVDTQMLSRHSVLFDLVLKAQTEHPALLELSLDERIKVFDPQDMASELLVFLQNYYHAQLKKVLSQNSVSFDQKSQSIRKLREIIDQLKQGKLVYL